MARLRVFAGPNGSGKSTIKNELRPEWLGVYINPDEIEKTIRTEGGLDLARFGIDGVILSALHDFIGRSSLLRIAGLLDAARQITLVNGRIGFEHVVVNSYFASVLSDFIRHELLTTGISFTFETVMSSEDKVAFLRKAQAQGFRTYLYFVATDDPDINLARVRQRVREGGHDVPPDKIVERYHRSIALLNDAVEYTNRTYIFDNSGDEPLWLAEVTDGQKLSIHADQLPHWFTDSTLWASFAADADPDA